ncbi:hypothetical protein E6C67_15985 [Azospirillum sp. TSA2s]|nr:hypothetical protein E6C67_15985 [Azospirillum sp. TSA2s]
MMGKRKRYSAEFWARLALETSRGELRVWQIVAMSAQGPERGQFQVTAYRSSLPPTSRNQPA